MVNGGETTTLPWKWVYHMTHIDNVPSIFEHGYLFSQNAMVKLGINYTLRGDPQIKLRRGTRGLRCSDGGIVPVSGCVPFYYITKTPMIYRLINEGIDKAEQVFFCFSTDRLRRFPWVTTSDNAASNRCRHSIDVADIHLFASRAESAPNVPGRKDDGRQAEFLVREKVPIGCAAKIGVYDASKQLRVLEALEQYPVESLVKHQVFVKEVWYP